MTSGTVGRPFQNKVWKGRETVPKQGGGHDEWNGRETVPQQGAIPPLDERLAAKRRKEISLRRFGRRRLGGGFGGQVFGDEPLQLFLEALLLLRAANTGAVVSHDGLFPNDLGKHVLSTVKLEQE